VQNNGILFSIPWFSIIMLQRLIRNDDQNTL